MIEHTTSQDLSQQKNNHNTKKPFHLYFSWNLFKNVAAFKKAYGLNNVLYQIFWLITNLQSTESGCCYATDKGLLLSLKKMGITITSRHLRRCINTLIDKGLLWKGTYNTRVGRKRNLVLNCPVSHSRHVEYLKKRRFYKHLKDFQQYLDSLGRVKMSGALGTVKMSGAQNTTYLEQELNNNNKRSDDQIAVSFHKNKRSSEQIPKPPDPKPQKYPKWKKKFIPPIKNRKKEDPKCLESAKKGLLKNFHADNTQLGIKWYTKVLSPEKQEQTKNIGARIHHALKRGYAFTQLEEYNQKKKEEKEREDAKKRHINQMKKNIQTNLEKAKSIENKFFEKEQLNIKIFNNYLQIINKDVEIVYDNEAGCKLPKHILKSGEICAGKNHFFREYFNTNPEEFNKKLDKFWEECGIKTIPPKKGEIKNELENAF